MNPDPIYYDPFVWFFAIGFTLLGFIFIMKCLKWLYQLSAANRKIIIRSFFTLKTITAMGEVVRESLFHRKIFKISRRLGYMHMSLALGWFMLILLGNIESTWYTGRLVKPIYISVFWRFFDPGPVFPESLFKPGFAFWMDFFLLLVISGLVLAIVKRFRSRWLGIHHTTKQRLADKWALASLWMIFPVRLLAESLTCGIHGTGSFLTGTIGYLFSGFPWIEQAAISMWWLYSLVLGVFFSVLMFTRYAHIPSEVVLIFLRQYGVKYNHKPQMVSDLSVHACSSCGVCLDPCQLLQSGVSSEMQSTYFLQKLRYAGSDAHQWECLLCGRCEQVCPVGLELINIRLGQRTDYKVIRNQTDLKTLPSMTQPVRVLYFAGCMTHLTPAIKESMVRILNHAGISWQFFDEHGEICCGRPLKLAGQLEAAKVLSDDLTARMNATGAHILVTSCPICATSFKHDYHFDQIRVVHHSEFIMELVEWEKLRLKKSTSSAAVHIPCELRAYDHAVRDSKNLIDRLYSRNLTPTDEMVCCGGSLGSTALKSDQNRMIAEGVMDLLTLKNPDEIVTLCPLCKHTLERVSHIPVRDLCEPIASDLNVALRSEKMHSVKISGLKREPA